ncbi:MAG: AAA family ATPase [Gemmatimonas sp.]
MTAIDDARQRERARLARVYAHVHDSVLFDAYRVSLQPDGRWKSDPAGFLVDLLFVPGPKGPEDPEDAVAWEPARPGAWWRRTGVATLLGSDNIARAGTAPLAVHATPERWLAAGGRGICVLDWSADLRALLGEAQLVTDSAPLARRLDRALGRWGATTVVPSASVRDSIPFDLPTVGTQTMPTDASQAALRAEPVGAFLDAELLEREMVLAPIIPTQGLAMLYSWRGIGKTHLALGMAYAVACGGGFLRWRAPRRRRVLYLDGEMPGRLMQERLTALAKADGGAPANNLIVLNGERQEPGAMPNLSTPEGQRRIESLIAREGIQFVVIDNIGTLCTVAKDNDVASWLPMQSWLLDLRRRGVSVLLVHHAGKGGAQRGTSSREDILDTSIRLVRPADYQASEGCRLEVRFEKTRGLFGKDVAPFEARLDTVDGRAVWTMRDVDDLAFARELFGKGTSVRDAADALGISKSAAHRLKHQVDAERVADAAAAPQ